MNFCDYLSNLIKGFNCCNIPSHGHGNSIGTLHLSNDEQLSSFRSSNDSLQYSFIGKCPETQETQRVTQTLFTDECLQISDINIQQLWDAVDNNDIQTVNEFIVNSKINFLEDFDGLTLLHRSVIAGNAEMTEILAQKGNLSATDNVGRTALHYSCMKNDCEIIKILLDAKADPYIQDSFGKIPVDYCAKSSEALKIFTEPKFFRKIFDSSEKNLSTESNSRVKRKKIHSNYEETVKSRLNKELSYRKSAQVYTGNEKVRKLTGPIDNKCSASNIRDFVIIKILGVGKLGEVYLVRDTIKNSEYAMKVIEKTKLAESKMLSMVLTDKKLLMLFDHPFIVPLIYSFQTKHKLILVTYFCSGGILSEQLLQKKILSSAEIRLYACEIIDALIYIHHKGFVYKGLTLKTVLLTEQGHIMLSNFQQACEFSVNQNENSENFVDGNGNFIENQEIDWVMLGKLLYELATGSCYVTGAPEIQDKELNDLVFKLLRPSGVESAEILNHDFFKDVCWKSVENQELEMPMPVGLDTYPQFTNLELSINESYTHEKPIQNWSFIELDDSLTS